MNLGRSIVGRYASAVGAALVAGTLLSASGGADDLARGGDDGKLSGRDIYERVIDNRFDSFSQQSRLISADRAGRIQESRFKMAWKDFRAQNGDAAKQVLTKTIVRYSHPFDIRHSGYLILNYEGRGPDQFVYYPSRRRVVRVHLRNEPVYGTDFSFEDVVPREAQEFDYQRLPDDHYEGVAVFVVELHPKELARSGYSKIWVYVDKERNVVLRSRYWDRAGVEIKEFSVAPARLAAFDGVWVPMESKMRNLLLDSHTQLIITDLVANPTLDRATFDLGKLEDH